jgi:hypothetical protein
MPFWKELDLAPTNDLRAIKRAYAQRLKQTRPEDDAAGFQRLRAAYEAALAHAERRQGAARPRHLSLNTPPPAPVGSDPRPGDEPTPTPPPRPVVEERFDAPRTAEPAPPPQRIPPHREASLLAHSVIAVLSEQGDDAAAERVQRLAAGELIDLELRELFEAELLKRLVQHPERPLRLLACCFATFHWGDNHHPLRHAYGNVFAFASRAQPVLDARDLLRQLAADEDRKIANWKAVGRAARLLLAPEPLRGFAFWNLSNRVLDAMAHMTSELRRRCGEACVLVVPERNLAFWESAVQRLPRNSPARVLSMVTVALIAAVVINRHWPIRNGLVFLLLTVGGGLGLSFAYRYLLFHVPRVGVPGASALKRWYGKWFLADVNPWKLWGAAAVASLFTAIPALGGGRLLIGAGAYFLTARWLGARERVVVFMVPSLIVAALAMPYLPSGAPWARLDLVHLWTTFAFYGLWQVLTRRTVIARVWRPVAHAGDSPRARAIYAGAFIVLWLSILLLPEQTRVAAWVFALIAFGYSINDRGLLFRSGGVAILAAALLPKAAPGLMALPFLGAHLLLMATAYGLFRAYDRICTRFGWATRVDGFYMALGVLVFFIGGIAAR